MRRFLLLLFFIGCLQSSGWAQGVSCPPNIDFELGNYSNWSFYTGACCPLTGMALSGPVANRHTLTSGTGVDPFGGFPVVAPGGGTYSLRIGNSNTGSQAERARYFLHVPTGVNNFSIIYNYAVVFQDPSHSSWEQPRFVVNVYDSATLSPINCAQYTYVATSNLPGFIQSTVNASVFYKPWTTASIDLSGLAGQTVIMDFETGDCDLGGHFGYGYIDVSCGLFQVQSVVCNASPTITLNAPPGFQYYYWYDSTFANQIATGSSVTLPTPPQNTLYNLILVPFSGFGCQDTLQSLVTISNMNLTTSNDTTVCKYSSFPLEALASGTNTTFSYTWLPSTDLSCSNCQNPILNALQTTVFSITASDNSGCINTDTVVVTVLDSDSTITSTICSGTSYLGYNQSGTYVDTFTSVTGCDSLRTLQLTVTPPPYVTITAAICAGDTLGGYTTSGVFVDTFSTALGCDSIRQLNLTVHPNTASTINHTHYCGSTYLGYSLAGQYIDTLVNANGCDSIRTLNLTVLPLPITPTTYTICQGQQYQGHTTSGVYYDTIVNNNGCDSVIQLTLTVKPTTYSTLNQTIVCGTSFLGYSVAGTYIDTLVNSNGCDSVRTLNLSIVPAPPTIWNHSICQGTTFMGYSMAGTYPDTVTSSWGCDSIIHLVLTVIPTAVVGVSHSMYCGDSYLGHTQPGVYVDSFTAVSGCDSLHVLNLNVLPLPVTSVFYTLCNGGSYQGYTSSGVYTDTFQTAAGCDSIRVLTLQVNPSYALTQNVSKCKGEALMVFGQSITQPGTYTFPSTTILGCDSTTQVIVSDYPDNAFQLPPDTAICAGESFQLQAGSYTNYLWNTGSTASSIWVNSAGTYAVWVKDANQCSYHDSITVSMNETPNVDIVSSVEEICSKEKIQLHATGANQYSWYLNSLNEFISNGTPIEIRLGATSTVIVRGTNEYNCSDMDSVRIYIIACCEPVIMPNAFSPNKDGVNDEFRSVNRIEAKEFLFQVYDRWGEKVFENRNTTYGWDGNFRDQPCPIGSYYYQISLKCESGETYYVKGDVMLVR